MIRLLSPALLVCLLVACAAPPPPARTEKITLLPSEDGKSSAIVVTQRSGRSVELNTPYAAAVVSGANVTSSNTTQAEVATQYPLLLAVQPPRIRSYTLYFETNRAVLTRESQTEVDRILGEAAITPAAEIDVIGHTDRRGSVESNDALGLTRAQFVANLMEGRGFRRGQLSVQSRGEREPLVPTADNVDEPRNRRVEIRLR